MKDIEQIKEILKSWLWQHFDKFEITDMGHEAIMIHVSKNGKGFNRELNVDELKRKFDEPHVNAWIEDLKYDLLVKVLK